MHHLEVSEDDGTITLALHGALDAEAGALLLESAIGATGGGARRLEVDVSGVTSYTQEGLDALLGCRSVAAELPEGLHYRAGDTVGFDVLLVALTPVRA